MTSFHLFVRDVLENAENSGLGCDNSALLFEENPIPATGGPRGCAKSPENVKKKAPEIAPKIKIKKK